MSPVESLSCRDVPARDSTNGKDNSGEKSSSLNSTLEDCDLRILQQSSLPLPPHLYFSHPCPQSISISEDPWRCKPEFLCVPIVHEDVLLRFFSFPTFQTIDGSWRGLNFPDLFLAMQLCAYETCPVNELESNPGIVRFRS
ncbi:hypothetical protein PIB30_016397 [Stylosanthes scabra]|uniref:Uncharacterized protein n=1 Tax=Stylosanthes scabra TaxID=79078 RepID=A0ABU6U642_9FABA|nr:hypothetical protein [Stylosanthes scabra]